MGQSSGSQDLAGYVKRSELDTYAKSADVQANTLWCADGSLCDLKDKTLMVSDGTRLKIGGTNLDDYIVSKSPIGPMGPAGPIGPVGPAGPAGAAGVMTLPEGPFGLDGTKWITGWGGFHAGYLNGTDVPSDSANSFTRDGVYVRRGNVNANTICTADGTICVNVKDIATKN